MALVAQTKVRHEGTTPSDLGVHFTSSASHTTNPQWVKLAASPVPVVSVKLWRFVSGGWQLAKLGSLSLSGITTDSLYMTCGGLNGPIRITIGPVGAPGDVAVIVFDGNNPASPVPP